MTEQAARYLESFLRSAERGGETACIAASQEQEARRIMLEKQLRVSIEVMPLQAGARR